MAIVITRNKKYSEIRKYIISSKIYKKKTRILIIGKLFKIVLKEENKYIN